MGNVNHPQHYQQEGRKECIVEMLEKYGFHVTAHFALLNSYKYLYRAGLKDGNSNEQDVSKAQWYLDWVDKKANDKLNSIIDELTNQYQTKIDNYNSERMDKIFNALNKKLVALGFAPASRDEFDHV